MISARLSRAPSPQAAALVRLAAFLVAAASVILVPTELAAAAAGHGSVGHAFATAGVATALTLVTALAARSLDPLRR